MVGNVSMNSTAVIPQSTEKPLKESSNFNNLLKGKMEGGEGKSKLEQNASISNDLEQKTTSKDGFVIDEVLSTISTKLEGNPSVDENSNLQEVINSLAAMLELLKSNISIENLPKEETSNLNIQPIKVEVPGISSIVEENKNVVQLQGTSVDLNELNTILNKVEEMINTHTVNVLDNKDNMSVVKGLLKDLGAKLQELTNNIKSQNTPEVIVPIKLTETAKNIEEKVLEDVIEGQATNVISKQGIDVIKEQSTDEIKGQITNINPVQGADDIKEQSTDKIKGQTTNINPVQGADDIKVQTTNVITEPDTDDIIDQSANIIQGQNTNAFKIKEVIKELIASNDSVNKLEQLQVNSSDVKVEELQTLTSSVRKKINTLLEVIKNPLSNDGTKVVNSEKQISEFELVKKFNLDGEASNNNSSKKDNNSNGSIVKEDKLLNSILNDKEELPVSRFTLLNNNINTGQVVNATEVQSINKGTIVQDVIKNVKYMVTNSTKELVVKINPKELGEVLISLVQEGGALKASIKASSKDTYNLLAQNLNEIKRNLAEQNIKVQGVDISLNQEMNSYNGESFSNSTFQGREENNRFRGNYRSNSEAGTGEEIEEGYYNEEIGNLNMLV